MRLLLLYLFTLISISAQDNATAEINQQIWKPFVAAFSSFDHVKMNDLHTDDVLRANKWGIRVGSEYKNRTTESYKRNLAAGVKQTINFWFEHRLVKGNIAYEVGYYKIKQTRDGKEAVYVARFHVVNKKENGRWRIAQDWDTNEINGLPITEADYDKKKSEF